jgi:hypothetical protein
LATRFRNHLTNPSSQDSSQSGQQIGDDQPANFGVPVCGQLQRRNDDFGGNERAIGVP